MMGCRLIIKIIFSKKYEAAKDLIKSVKQEKENLSMELNEVGFRILY